MASKKPEKTRDISWEDYNNTRRMSKQGQISIPATIRDRLKIKDDLNVLFHVKPIYAKNVVVLELIK